MAERLDKALFEYGGKGTGFDDKALLAMDARDPFGKGGSVAVDSKNANADVKKENEIREGLIVAKFASDQISRSYSDELTRLLERFKPPIPPGMKGHDPAKFRRFCQEMKISPEQAIEIRRNADLMKSGQMSPDQFMEAMPEHMRDKFLEKYGDRLDNFKKGLEVGRTGVAATELNGRQTGLSTGDLGKDYVHGVIAGAFSFAAKGMGMEPDVGPKVTGPAYKPDPLWEVKTAPAFTPGGRTGVA